VSDPSYLPSSFSSVSALGRINPSSTPQMPGLLSSPDGLRPSGSSYNAFFVDPTLLDSFMVRNTDPMPPTKSNHPSFGSLTLLVLGAVMEVVFVSLPGYIIAKYGMMDPESQKFLANLNVMLFTPCLSTFISLGAQAVQRLIHL
jgi:hypothetical protein